MKTNLTYLVTLLLIGMVSLNSCKKYTVERDVHLPGVDYELSGNLVCIDETAELSSTDTELEQGLYNFTYDGINVPFIQEGNIIVGEQNNGFLRKVTEVLSRSETGLSLRTTQAALTDAFLAGSEMFDLSYETLITDFDQDTLLEGSGFQLLATSGSLSFQPNVDLEYMITDSTLNQMIVNYSGDLNIDLETRLISGNLSEIEEQSFLVNEKMFSQKFLVNAGEKEVPVIITTDVKIIGYLSSSSGVSIDTTELDWDWNVIQQLTYTYSDNVWTGSPTSAALEEMGVTKRNSFDNSHYQLKFVPQASVRIYNVEAFDFQQPLGVDYNFTTDDNDNWCNTLDANVDVNLNSFPQIIDAKLSAQSFEELVGPSLFWQAPFVMEIEGDMILPGGPNEEKEVTVKLFDTRSNGVSNAKIYYEILEGGGSISSPTSLTNASGIATNTWTYGNNSDMQILKAYWKKNDGIARDSVVFMSEPPPCDLTASLMELTAIECYGTATASIALEVNGGTDPISYQWNNGETNDTLNDLTAGTYVVTITDLFACSFVDSIVINQPNEITIVVDGTTEPGCSNDAGEINITASGGTGALNYSWNNGAISEDIDMLSGGLYTVTVMDGNGCTATLDTMLQNIAGITATAASDNVSCNGANDGSINVTASGAEPLEFEWNTGQTTEDINGLSQGAYQLTITDANGCTDTSIDITIAEPAALTVEIDPTNPNCNNGNDGEATANPAGGTEPYTYSWSNGSVSMTIPNLPADTYTVTLTDVNGCTATASETLTDPTALNIEVTSTTNPACFGEATGSINIEASGGSGDYDYVWTSGQTTSFIDGLTANTYTVTVTDANNCSAVETVTLDEPSQALNIEVIDVVDPKCNGDSNGMINIAVTGGSGSYTYSWNDGAMADDRMDLPQGNYELTVTDGNGCEATEVINLDEPDVLEANPSDDATIAMGESVTVSVDPSGGTPPYTYDWNNDLDDTQSSHVVTPIESGYYNVFVTDANDCEIGVQIFITVN